VRVALLLGNVEDLLHERGMEVSHETVRCWRRRFGPMCAAEIQARRREGMRSVSRWRWPLDEVVVRVSGVRHDPWRAVRGGPSVAGRPWRAVGHEGEVLEAVVTKRRDKAAALRCLEKLTRRHGRPEEVVTDKPRSCGAALKEMGGKDRRVTERGENNRAGTSHQPFRRRERAMLRFRQMHSLQKFGSVHSSVHDHFNSERSLTSRPRYKEARTAALAEWRALRAGRRRAHPPTPRRERVRLTAPA
jgi:putative transposase